MEIQRQREEALKTKEEQEQAELEAIRRYKQEKEETLRRRRELEEQENQERLRIKRRDEQEEQERLRLIKIANEEALRLRQKLNELKEQESIRISKIRQMEEEEALRIQKLAEEEAAVMLQRLRAVEEEEAERRKQKRIKALEQELYQQKLRNLKRAELEAERLKSQHFKMINSKRLYTTYQVEYTTGLEGDYVEETLNDDDIDALGITEDELDLQCDELFMTAPIVFKPNKNSEIDMALAKLVRDLKITMPVVHVKESCYLIGSQRANLLLKRDQLLVKRGGGGASEPFQEFYLTNKRQLERGLVVFMIRSGESLEYVVDCLVNGKKIKNTAATSITRTSNGGRLSLTQRSPTTNRASLRSRLERSSAVGTTPTSGRLDMSPAERLYREQKDRIFGDLKKAILSKYF